MRRFSARRALTHIAAAVLAIGTLAGGNASAAPNGAPGYGQPAPGYGAQPMPVVGGPGYGQPNPGYMQGNGTWMWPGNLSYPRLRLSSTTGDFTSYVVGNMMVAIRNDGQGITWGTFNDATGRWTGYWIVPQGIACPLPLPAPSELTGLGFQFQAPLYTWGTFDVSYTANGMAVQFNGAWGACGAPIGGAWNGTMVP